MPYIDFNPKGNGYYTFNERKFAITTFLFGFLVLWVVLIVLGTFLRGPNWNFFGPFEYWDSHKVDAAQQRQPVGDLLGPAVPHRACRSSGSLREMPGFMLVAVLCLCLPLMLAKAWLKRTSSRWASPRYYVTVTLFLQFMTSLPIKMVLRWTINLKYIVYIPEFFFNI